MVNSFAPSSQSYHVRNYNQSVSKERSPRACLKQLKQRVVLGSRTYERVHVIVSVLLLGLSGTKTALNLWVN